MNKTIPAIAAALFLAHAAHADVKLVQRVSVNNAQLNAMMASMSPDQKAQMAQLGFSPNLTAITFLKGTHARADFAQSSFVADGTAHTLTQINRLARTFSVQPLPAAVRKTAGVNAVVRDTGQRKVILGHAARHYTVRVSSPDAPNGGISADLWVATDLPSPPVSGLQNAPLQSAMAQIHGLPLQTTVTIKGGQGGTTTIKSVAQSVSTTPLPASTFAVPAGYTKTPPGTSPVPAFAGGGGGFGGQ